MRRGQLGGRLGLDESVAPDHNVVDLLHPVVTVVAVRVRSVGAYRESV